MTLEKRSQRASGARGSSPLVGMLLADWLRVVRQVSGIPPRCWGRLGHITFQCLLNQALHAEERAQFGGLVAEQQPQAPIFVLGLPRSGTTFLHQALCLDGRFAFPTRTQVYCPHTFLTMEGRGGTLRARILRRLNQLWSRLVYGNLQAVREDGSMGVNARFFLPAEDEFALAMNGHSSHLTYIFPQERARFERYRVWTDLEPKEQQEWERRWLDFLKKLTLRYPEKRLVLKSHQHMGRIEMLLRLFPQSRFLFISREPAAVLRSRLELRARAIAYWGLQDWNSNPAEELEEGARTVNAYLRERVQIPPGQLHEIRYEEFCLAPLKVLEGAYQALSLPDFELARESLEAGLVQLREHRSRSYPELPAALARQLREAWDPYYEAFGYGGKE